MKSPAPRLPVPLNEAEAIIEPFWDERLSPLASYTLRNARGPVSECTAPIEQSAPTTVGIRPQAPPAFGPLPPDQVRASQFWCWLTLAWDRPPGKKPAGRRAAAPLLSFERQLRVDLAGYDRIIVRASCPKHVLVTVVATVDGVERTVVDAEPGRGNAHEFEGKVHGKTLERICLKIASERDGTDEVWLYWIGCAHAKRRKAMLARTPPFTPDWAGWLLPEGSPVEFTPRFGFYFDAGELEAIRRKALSPLYQPIMDQLRATARDAMSDSRTPEGQIGPFLASGDIWAIQSRERDAKTRSFHIDAPVCAFVGLIDQDPACLRFAARIAVSIAHTTTWAPHFMQSFPGSTWDTRGFPEAHVTAGIALALDWAGAWFTPKGEHLVRYAIATKGLPRIREAFLQYEYMWNCNQHHMIGLGRLLGLLVLQQAWPRTMADIDVCERDLYEIIDRYIQPDGSTNEGVGYWSNSFRATLPALAALARVRGKDLPAMIPPKLRTMDNYIASLLSTAGEPGSYHPIADTVGDAVAVDAIGMLAAALDTPLWKGLMADCLRRGKKVKRDWSFDGFFAVIHGPEHCPDEEVNLPAFTKLAKAGTASSFRRLGQDSVRLFLVGAMENAGHCHRDKGSFILEVAGEPFAIDRGAVPYEDAANLPFMKSEAAHNLAVPEGCAQQNPSPHASDWIARGDDTFLTAEIDTGRTWLPPVISCRRTINSATPDRIEIIDEIELSEPRAVAFLLHSPLPMRAGKGKATVRGTRFTLEITADWTTAGTVTACGVNWCYTPINRLALTSAPARQHRLVTVLRLVRRKDGPPSGA
jgi:hypothetical protein